MHITMRKKGGKGGTEEEEPFIFSWGGCGLHKDLFCYSPPELSPLYQMQKMVKSRTTDTDWVKRNFQQWQDNIGFHVQAIPNLPQ